MDRRDKLTIAKNKNSDYMPDEFYYSVAGYSGKFLFSQLQNKFLLFPKDDIIVDYDISASPSEKITNWELKLPNGTQVLLGVDAMTSSKTVDDERYTTNSWRIGSIKNIYNEEINYSYTQFSYSQFKITGQNFSIRTVGEYATSFNTGITRFDYQDCRPSEITFPGGSVSFITTFREDMPAAVKSLSEILVKDKNGSIVKRVKFVYSYFNGTSFDMMGTLGYSSLVPESQRHKRLRLDKIEISGQNDGVKSYTFSYHEPSVLPSKFSFSR